MAKQIKIFDTTLRDGEQVPGCKLNHRQKLLVAKQLEALGVDVLEAGFPISSPGDFKAVEMISKELSYTTICALSRSVENDIKVAAEALKYAKYPRIHTGIGTSPDHIKYKFNSTPDKIIERARAAVKYAKTFVEDVEFYAEDAGRTSNEYLAKVIQAVVDEGATVLNIPDTTGYCMPDEYGAKIQYLVENVRGIDKCDISAHCHNDLGMATANSIAAVIGGATQIECTVKFAHSSGIHQDGVIKHRANYEIIDPKIVGVDQSKIVLTARSGRAALAYRSKNVGYDLSKDELDIVYKEFINIADKQTEVNDNDLNHMLQSIFKKAI